MDEVKPIEGEAVIVKNVNSGFMGTNLKELLDNIGTDTLVLAGMTTNHCVSTTARMAYNMAYKTIIIADATASFDRIGLNGEMFDAELIHQRSLASLNEEFAEIMNTLDLLKNL